MVCNANHRLGRFNLEPLFHLLNSGGCDQVFPYCTSDERGGNSVVIDQASWKVENLVDGEIEKLPGRTFGKLLLLPGAERSFECVGDKGERTFRNG